MKKPAKLAVDLYPFPESFQRALCNLLVSDLAWAHRVLPVLDDDGFSSAEPATLVKVARRFREEHQEAPSVVELRQAFAQGVYDGWLTAKQAERVGHLLEELEAGVWLGRLSRENAERVLLKEVRQRRFLSAFDQALGLAKQGQFEDVLGLFEDSYHVLGAANGVGDGHGLAFGQVHLPPRSLKRTRFPTGIAELDAALEGGLGAGELGVIAGLPKGGKSMCLLRVALHSALQGRPAVYYTLELSEEDVVARAAAALSGVLINEARRDGGAAMACLQQRLLAAQSAFVVRHFPAGMACVRDVRRHLNQLHRQFSVKPGLVVVDYGDIFAAQNSIGKRYDDLGTVYTDLRGLAEEMGIPVWTGSQGKRDAAEKEVVEMQDLAESFRKAHVADLIVGLCRSADEKTAEQLRLYIAACRFAADGVELGPFQTDYARGRFVAEGWE